LTLPLSSDAQTPVIHKPVVSKTADNKPSLKIPAHTRFIKRKVINRATRVGITATIKLYAGNSEKKLISTISTDSVGRYELQLPDTGMSRFFRIVYCSSDIYLERTLVVDRDKTPSFLTVSLLKLEVVEIVATTLDTTNNIYIRHFVPFFEHQERTHSGTALIFVPEKKPLHKRAWNKLRYPFRKIFRKIW